MKRRTFMKGGVVTVVGGSAVVLGLLNSKAAFAAWNEKAFSSPSVDDALKNGFGSTETQDSDQVQIEAPDVAANGAMVQIAVDTQIPKVETIAIISEKNSRPLCCTFRPGPGVRSKVKIRIKMGKTSDVIGVVKAEGKLYTARRSVKVTAGGCG